MTRDLLLASLRALPGRAVALHVAAAAALVAVTWNGLDEDGLALTVLRGVAVLLAATLALAVDEPSAAVVDAAPTPLSERLRARAALVAAGVVPLWLLALLVVSSRGGDLPATAVTLEAAALAVLATAVAMSLRRWWQVVEPAVAVGPLLLGGLVAASQLPRGLVLLPASPLDPAWQQAHQRWALVLLAALVLLVAAAADPSTATTRRPLLGSR